MVFSYVFCLFVDLSTLKLRKFSQNEEIFGRPEASGGNGEKAGFERRRRYFQYKFPFFFRISMLKNAARRAAKIFEGKLRKFFGSQRPVDMRKIFGPNKKKP